MSHIYLAVFRLEKTGGYFVNFPDIDGCFTEGRDWEDALKMAVDVLALRLAHWQGSLPKAAKHKKLAARLRSGEELVPVPLDAKLFFKYQPRTTINATLPTDLLAELDRYRAQTGEDRSLLLAEGARLLLKQREEGVTA